MKVHTWMLFERALKFVQWMLVVMVFTGIGALVGQCARAADVDFSWTKSDDTRVTGYEFAYGPTSGSRTQTVKLLDLGQATITLPNDMLVFAQLRAVGNNLTSDWTNEVAVYNKAPVFGVFTGNNYRVDLGSSFTLRAGWSIDAIGTAGGTGGTPFTVTIPSGEFITTMKGLIGTRINQLAFVTNKGTTLGPYGDGKEPNGAPATSTFLYTAPLGQQITALAGTANTLVFSVGAVLAPAPDAPTPTPTATPTPSPTPSPVPTPVPPLTPPSQLIIVCKVGELTCTITAQ